ncbi:hypothetical protein AB6N24_09935 [Cellulomonas sp. 179-A 4D5 NHS]|uniref:hypothetical protein n=1 Tax=Cellulomonas sp. 179-A 4D5 NHS TaxID=3142378 RepID=UPI0039A1BDC7
MHLGIGTNLIVSDQPVAAVLSAGGGMLVKAETVNNGPLVASLNIWNAAGDHIAKLRRGAWVFNHRNLEVTTSPEHLTLTDGDQVLAEVLKTEPDKIWIRRLDLYTPDGLRVLVQASNDFDLEVLDGDRSLIRLDHCRFNNPECVLNCSDTQGNATTASSDGIHLSRAAEQVVFSYCTFDPLGQRPHDPASTSS